MTRSIRERSQSGFYHVMLRGINHQQIFLDNHDYRMCIDTIRKCKDVSGFKLHSWCLMGNHLHMLIEEGEEPVDIIFRRFGVRFVSRYNSKYERTGHLFQDRYLSDTIESEYKLISVMRYIHSNPVKAGIVDDESKYPWSSISCYLGIEDGITDTNLINGLIFPSSEELGTKEKKHLLIATNTNFAQDPNVEFNSVKRIDDNTIAMVLLVESKCMDLPNFKRGTKQIQKDAIKAAIARGGSYRQIARLTGYSKTYISRLASGQ